MAALAIPPLAAAVDWLLAALGVTAAAGGAVVVSEEVKRRQQAASEAGTGAAAQTATQTRTKTCQKCPPDCGVLVERKWNMSAAARDYQARVTGFVPYTEWAFGGIDFDGFSSADCMLKEAKSRYDQFLTEGEDAELEPRKWYRAFTLKMLPQAERQAAVARAALPSRLTWFFQGPKTYEYMGAKVSAFLPLVAVYMP
jgi:Restriction endonuclease fold toxin 5